MPQLLMDQNYGPWAGETPVPELKEKTMY